MGLKKRILIIDDDLDMCVLLSRFLNKKGYEAETAANGAKGLALFKEEDFDVVLCDFRLGDKSGREILLEIKELNPQTAVIIITGYSDIKIAVDVIKHGAFDYIVKPLVPDEVINVIEKSLKAPGMMITQPAAEKDEKSTKKQAKAGALKIGNDYLMGQSDVIKNMYQQVEIVADTDYSVILYGESGTGKEVVARTIHENSPRRKGPFIAMDCGTLSKELAGSELFGHVKGAFTGAITNKTGQFELANGGTLFLDEVANLSKDVQASLLRVIQERKFKKIGGNKFINVDVRIIVASNENLREAYQKGKFREDLYHRFNEFSIYLPPLRDRGDDILLFSDFFLNRTKEELNRDIDGFDEKVLQVFRKYPWPGNLREFRNVVRRSALLTQAGKITLDVLPWEIRQSESFEEVIHSN